MEGKTVNNQSADVVSREEYNKIVEAHNSMKAEKEKIESSIKAKEAAESSKQEWQKVAEENKAALDELKSQVAEMKDEKVSKGVVAQENNQNKKMTSGVSREELIKQLQEAIPYNGIKNTQNMSPIQRYGYYKAPTQGVSNQMLGMALSLDAGRYWSRQANVSPFARQGGDDVIVHRGSRQLG